MKNYALIFVGLIILSVFVVFGSSSEANIESPKQYQTVDTGMIAYVIKNESDTPKTKMMKRNFNDTIWGKSDDSDLKILEKHHAVLTNQLSKVDSLIEVKKKKK